VPQEEQWYCGMFGASGPGAFEGLSYSPADRARSPGLGCQSWGQRPRGRRRVRHVTHPGSTVADITAQMIVEVLRLGGLCPGAQDRADGRARSPIMRASGRSTSY